MREEHSCQAAIGPAPLQRANATQRLAPAVPTATEVAAAKVRAPAAATRARGGGRVVRL